MSVLGPVGDIAYLLTRTSRNQTKQTNSVSLSVCLAQSLSVSVSLCVSPCLFLFVSLSFSLLSLSLSLSLFLFLFLFLTLTQSISCFLHPSPYSLNSLLTSITFYIIKNTPHKPLHYITVLVYKMIDQSDTTQHCVYL